MNAFSPACTDERRRQLIRDRKLNGVDYVDVVGSRLCVHFLTGIPPEFRPSGRRASLTPEEKTAAIARIVVRGGRRVTGIRVIDVDPEDAPSAYEEACLGIQLDREGDWSTYTLCFVETKDGRPTGRPLASLDPRYACLDFTFKADCPADLDCKSTSSCALEERPTPAVSYLAKDYATFRQLILDRLALTMPSWRERHVPDVGIALVELLAYVGDYLSYFQDAVATEQYLATARQRISVRRHARLVDYAMHEGCNARAFVQLQVASDAELEAADLYFTTGEADGRPVLRQSEQDKRPPGSLVFEPLAERTPIKVRVAHNLIRIYTWGNEECCVPKGATRVTLLDELVERDELDPALCDERPWPPVDHEHHEGCGCGEQPPPKPATPRALDLQKGDLLLFEELACAGTAFNGDPKRGGFDGRTPMPDVDRSHRHVVCITRVTRSCDALRGNRVLEVEWCVEDALPFALCVSAIGAAPECDLVEGLAVARGNIVLVDHGATIRDEPLPTVESLHPNDVCEGEDAPADVTRTAARYRPRLRRGPLTFAQPVDGNACASTMMTQDARSALPALSLAGIPASYDGNGPLFDPASFSDLLSLTASLVAPTDPALVALRRRLTAAVKTALDAGTVTEALVLAVETNLRALTERWVPRADLLDSHGDEPSVVAEIDDSGFAWLRFGDGDSGRAVEAGMSFLATYRVGNGRAGLVGPESIAHAVMRQGFSTVITGVRNPLPSAAAMDPEPVAEVKMFAPGAFRASLGRAVTADDYAALAQTLAAGRHDPRIQSASGRLAWTGSWYEAGVAVDPFATSDLDSSLQRIVEDRLSVYRRMGHDLRVRSADVVALRLELDLCIAAEYNRGHVLAAVRDALSSRALPGGRRGFFHPDNLTFGRAIYVSRIIQAVMAVEGVSDVKVVRLERLGHRKHRNPDLPKGLLALTPNEIARLDNDAAAPENGIITFRRVRGGR